MKNSKLFASIFTFLSLLFTSCSANNQLKGEMCGERFYDQNCWYSIEVPKNYQHQMADCPSSDGSHATFGDFWGNLHRYEVFLLPESIKNNIPDKNEFFKNIFVNCAVDIKEKFDNTTVKEFKYLPEHEAFFAILNIPEGGTLIDTSTNKTLDSERGYLIFIKDKYVVILSNQVVPHLYKQTGNLVITSCLDINKSMESSKDLLLQDLLEMKKDFRLKNAS